MITATENWGLWHHAASLDELAALTARWLDGELPECFGYRGTPNPETAEIPAGILPDLNRSGFLTYASQPGCDWTVGVDGAQWRQRAHVGFLLDTRHLVDVVDAVAGGDGGLVPVLRRARRARLANWWRPVEWPITERRLPGHAPTTTCTAGHAIARSYWRMVGRGYRNPTMGRLLAGAWQLDVVDLEWGDNTRLWNTLAPLTARSVRPGPGPQS